MPARDAIRLAAWVQARAEGNPFYAGELLRGLEEQGVLRSQAGGWILGEPARASLPPLLRQVIDGRIARLGGEAQRALEVAAVLGQEIPLALWATVGQVEEVALLTIVGMAEETRLLAVTGDGTVVRFAHALIREALYAGTAAVQRRTWHCRTGEALAGLPDPDPDAVAYHFQRAGDPRSVEWLLRAADRAERASAWRSAADRCTAALALLERQGVVAAERGWLGYRIAALCRYRDPRGALTRLEAVARLAAEANDPVLGACTRFLSGNVHCYVGEFGPGLAALDAGIAALDALAGENRERLRVLGAVGGFVPDTRQLRGTLVMRLAGTGRFVEACRLGGGLFGPDAALTTAGGTGDLAEANASRGLAVAYAALGQPHAARRAFARARAVFQQLGDHFHVGMTAMQELQWVMVPYRADRPAEWDRLAEEAERAWTRADDAPADLPEGFARLPVLLLAGRWSTARELALAVYADGGSYKATAARALAMLAREQGDMALARRLIEDELPAGPDTPEGTANFSTVLLLQRLAAALALDAGDASEAREWLTAHDRWVAWSEAALGQAESQIEWAAYHRAAGDMVLARRHAERALAGATELHQPLALLAAHRLIGECDATAHRFVEASGHLDQALTLANACAAPYERALTLLALAELRLTSGESAAVRPLVEESRGICASLGARPALARAEALTSRLAHMRVAEHDRPAGLSAREIEVLRLIAAGESNREIAGTLALSVRTVEKHIANIYGKLGARGRVDAAAFAVRHGLVAEAADLP
jgi:DNA-binding CsgD family transcriptional regulator/tetratricopeptide (TPR) repeat protein